MYFASPLGAGCTRNFYANNVAFRREVLERAADTARTTSIAAAARCWGSRCKRAGSRFASRPARTQSTACPTRLGDLVRLRLLRGADAVELAPHLARAYLPRGARWLARLGPLSGLAVLAVRCACSLIALRQQRHTAVRGPRWFAGAALVAALHAADATGAIIRGFRLGLAAPARRNAALAYHENVDRLAA